MIKKAMGSKSSNKAPKVKYKRIEEEQLKCAFHMFDTNRDGRLNGDELRNMMSSVGIEVSDRLVTRLFKEAARNESQLITEQEFLHWFSRFKTPKDDDVEADLKAAFAVFDKDNNGFITRDELKRAMRIMDEPITDHDLDELLKCTDHDKDGKINYEEFIKTLL